MHTLGIVGEDDARGLATFWVVGRIEYVRLLMTVDYPTWNIKLMCNGDLLDDLKETLRTQGILGKDWVKNTEKYINISTNKAHVKDQIALMDDSNERDWMDRLCDGKKIPFTYDGITDNNPNPGHDHQEFRQGRHVAVEFMTHAINFRTRTNSKPSLMALAGPEALISIVFLTPQGKKFVQSSSTSL